MPLTFRRVVLPRDGDTALTFFAGNKWPFHARALSPETAAGVTLVNTSVESYWILDDDDVVGLVRLLDLLDIPHGSPLFDLRIGELHRRRGIGTQAVRWLTEHLFGIDEALHRIEATTRADNAAMRAVLERCGYRQEGEFREAWLNEDGTRSNTMAYALLRSDWRAARRDRRV